MSKKVFYVEERAVRITNKNDAVKWAAELWVDPHKRPNLPDKYLKGWDVNLRGEGSKTCIGILR